MFLEYKFQAFVIVKYDGDYELAYDMLDDDRDGKLNSDEVYNALDRIDVGNVFTRGSWVKGIFGQMDISPRDGKLSYHEMLGVSTPTDENSRAHDTLSLTLPSGWDVTEESPTLDGTELENPDFNTVQCS
jgi:hypothetical protein